MKVAILCQEEPVFLYGFLQGVLCERPSSVCAVFLAGRRGGGERTRTRAQRREALRVYWLIMEPRGFLGSIWLRARARLLGPRDPRSVEGLARRLGIPVCRIDDPNAPAFRERLRETGVDIVLNQSERLLKPEVLAVPRRGFVNRHASLLPRFRGRLASFRAHAAEPPSYGVTIHQVGEGIDTGDIILQEEFRDIPARLPYPQVARALFSRAPRIFWLAMDRMVEPGFRPKPNEPCDAPFKFPTLEEARNYRRIMRMRRGGGGR